MKVYDGPGFVAAKTGATILPYAWTERLLRSYFSRLSGSHPRSILPRSHSPSCPPRFISMPDAPSTKLRRRIAGEAMRRDDAGNALRIPPDADPVQRLSDADQIHGRRTRLLEDMQQMEEPTARSPEKEPCTLGRADRISAPGENVGILLPNVTNTICLIFGIGAYAGRACHAQLHGRHCRNAERLSRCEVRTILFHRHSSRRRS